MRVSDKKSVHGSILSILLPDVPRIIATLLLFLFVFGENLPSQTAADPTVRYFRVIALVHLTGSGQKGDPKRPEFVPDATSRDGILSWSMQKSDDGKYALIQLVAVNHKALKPILADRRPDVRVFEIGKTRKDDIEKELKKFKKDFDLSQFLVVAQ